MTATASVAATVRTRRLLAQLALGATVLTFVVVVASAFIRHTQAGLGCADWPACYGRIAADAQPVAPSIGVHLARVVHRLAASAALLLIVGMVLVARRAALRTERNLALAALAVALLLAALGLFTPGATVPAVPLGNLLGGYLMLALLSAHAGIVTGSGSGADPTASPRLPWLALALIGAMFVQACVGALIGTQFALRSCPDLGRCGDHVPTLAGALNPLEPLRVVEGHFVAPPGAAHLHTIHRALGAVVSIAALALAWAMRPGHRYVAALVAVLALLTPLLGAAALLWMPSLPLTVLHNAAAAAMIAVLAAIAAIRRTTRRRAFSGMCPPNA